MAAQEKKTFKEVLKDLRGKKILVANRGIPARRIARTIREMAGAVAIMTATDVDRTSPAVTGVQELMLLGDNPRAYLDIDRIVRKAKARGIAAIHPGWGFSAEDYSFPAKCRQAGIKFIGPDADAMHTLGNKVAVRSLAQKLGIPVVPGSEGAVSIPEARQVAEETGYPVMLKAEGGGGGRGIYEVFSPEELEAAFSKASAMAQASFGNPRLYVERLLRDIRHIEIQVIADKHGNVFAFDERDCTVQRNHQKLVEITPSPWAGMTPELRETLKEYARKLVAEVGYYSLATVEFLVEKDGTPSLIEVNTRLQVEHGITECRYGIDLVEEQIAVSFGAELRFNEKETLPRCHAIQTRINCEDPQNNFSPNAGRITRYVSPGGPGTRLDSCISQGYEFPSQYDSAATLLVGYGDTWKKALRVLERALQEYHISGVKTTLPFHRKIVCHEKFRAGEFSTNFIHETPELMQYTEQDPEAHRLGRLIAEISALGYNPHVQLGKYRGVCDKRVGPFTPVLPRIYPNAYKPRYPAQDRQAALDHVRDSRQVHFTDTTTRDITQSNSGNRFRWAEDKLIAQYLDNCHFFSLENGGGAHFHVAMLANMTYPFTEAALWNEYAPKTMKQILVRSTNTLGYKPQPKNLMRKTAEMISEHYHVIRCFDFLNHIDNMRPFAEVVLHDRRTIFEPALSLSYGKDFDVEHYLAVAASIVQMVCEVAGVSGKQAQKMIILGLKDMAGVCPPRFMYELVSALRRKYPDLILHYHRHYTDGLFVPACGEAARAGAHIIDAAIGSSVRWYGQGEVLSTAAYIEELGRETHLNTDMIRHCNFMLKQIMPYYDRYTTPYFQGIDYDVVRHGMPGGATSSSQEGALQQGYIHLLPYMLEFLAQTRLIVRYHDVTPGSQITWNTAFLAVTGAFKRGGDRQVRELLEVLEYINTTPENELSDNMKQARLSIYQDANDAFRELLMGNYGPLPLGFPPEWVYESAFGSGEYKTALAKRSETSPLVTLEDIDIQAQEAALCQTIRRSPTEEELVMYLNHPGDALKTIEFVERYGDPNNIPLDVWFEGLETGREIVFYDSTSKPHSMTIHSISEPDEQGVCTVRYALDSENMNRQVKVGQATGKASAGVEMADPDNPMQVGAPSAGDLWIMYVCPGDEVHEGEELFNVSIMKQEKAVLSPVAGVVERVLKTADYQDNKKMVPVLEGELLVEIGPVPRQCPTCKASVRSESYVYCPQCSQKL